ncbi:Hypothetical predicted protein [Olea europaea subsp. europaea]|uniref:Uncharacterized protein n=1 Tax=Olea europaea subsp. europaea TaxID=158383 RepID=A0A8S0Q4W4_OLEEU|nr:Hypothetical predicted protein [Olea europaea subsp. europaea]
MELPNTDPPTPSITVPCMNLTNEETEITTNDLEVINYELEKFLEAGAKEIVNDSSERSSQASIITLINKQIEGVDSGGHKHSAMSSAKFSLRFLIEPAGSGVEAKRKDITWGPH